MSAHTRNLSTVLLQSGRPSARARSRWMRAVRARATRSARTRRRRFSWRLFRCGRRSMATTSRTALFALSWGRRGRSQERVRNRGNHVAAPKFIAIPAISLRSQRSLCDLCVERFTAELADNTQSARSEFSRVDCLHAAPEPITLHCSPLSLPVAEQAANIDELCHVIRVVVGYQQRFAQNGLTIAPWNFGEEIGLGVLD